MSLSRLLFRYSYLFEAQQLCGVCKLLALVTDKLAPFFFLAKNTTNLKDLYENEVELALKH